MFVYPTSQIWFLRNVPLDTTYEHTIYFDTIQDQENYFGTKRKPDIVNALGKTVSYYLSGQQYQRVGKNIRVGILADDLWDCNYLMFRNTNFGNKWFYAFIKNITYINNEVSEVEYEIDVMQTWFFNYKLEMCYVEREHAASDQMFEHYIDENLDCGREMESVHVYGDFLYQPSNMSLICLYAGTDTTGISGHSNLLPSGYYLPCYYNFYPNTAAGATGMSDFITDGNHIRDPQEVISVYQAPAVYDSSTATITDVTTDLTIASNSHLLFDGYEPRNKKLYSSPFNCVIVSNNNGGSAVYKFENSNESNHDIKLRRMSNSIPMPSAIVFPRNYRGMTDDWDSGLIFDNFPVSGWVTDTFKCWWAQHKTTFASGIITTAINGVTGAGNTAMSLEKAGTSAGMTAGLSAGTGVLSTLTGVMNSIAKLADLEAMPNQAAGQFKSDVLNLRCNRLGYVVYHMHIKKYYAVMIDQFFDKYGYACKKVKYPNRKARALWCYTKTVGCVIAPSSVNGGLPCDDEAKICSIYDSGITFWKYTYGVPLEVGNYSYQRNNAPNGVEGG